jgi:hypothetical protein
VDGPQNKHEGLWQNRDRKVIANTGQRMDLQCGTERREVWRPKDQELFQMFISLRPGQSVDDSTLAMFEANKPHGT